MPAPAQKPVWSHPSTLRGDRLAPHSPSVMPRESQTAKDGGLHPKWGALVLPCCWSWASPAHQTQTQHGVEPHIGMLMGRGVVPSTLQAWHKELNGSKGFPAL